VGGGRGSRGRWGGLRSGNEALWVGGRGEVVDGNKKIVGNWIHYCLNKKDLLPGFVSPDFPPHVGLMFLMEAGRVSGRARNLEHRCSNSHPGGHAPTG